MTDLEISEALIADAERELEAINSAQGDFADMEVFQKVFDQLRSLSAAGFFE